MKDAVESEAALLYSFLAGSTSQSQSDLAILLHVFK